MDQEETACLCGHPKLRTSRKPEHTDEGRAILLRLEAIKARRSELAREMGSLTVEEDRLRSRLTSMRHGQD